MSLAFEVRQWELRITAAGLLISCLCKLLRERNRIAVYLALSVHLCVGRTKCCVSRSTTVLTGSVGFYKDGWRHFPLRNSAPFGRNRALRAMGADVSLTSRT